MHGNVINPSFFMRQKVMSVWQSEVQTTLMRTSCARGGATSTSTVSSGSPAALHTAALHLIGRAMPFGSIKVRSEELSLLLALATG